MKKVILLSFFFVAGLLLTALLLSSCRNRKHKKEDENSSSLPTQVTKIVNIINSTNNNIYNQQRFQNIIVQNIDNSRREYTENIINNLQYNTQNVMVNNTNVALAVDNSITNNYVSQTAIQKIYNDNRRYDGNKYYDINVGDQVEITNVNIGGVTVGGIIAEVNNDYTYSSSTDIVISQEAYQQIINQISNYRPVRKGYECSKCGMWVNDGEKHHCSKVAENYRQCPKCGAIMERGHKCYPCRKCGKYFVKGTKHICDTEENPPINIFTVIGFFVVVLFILGIISWVRNIMG